MDSKFRHIAEELRREVELQLSRIGLLCRVFGRGKDEDSIASKLTRQAGKYSTGGRLIQDAIGIRIALYFEEDTEIVAKILRGKYELDSASSTIDVPATDQFSVNRHNLIFRMPESYVPTAQRAIGERPIDHTFEVQLRSVLSEGWHEVDHDLRYKCKSYWQSQDDLSRALNGIMATLETAEWSMHRIFEDLAYRHYRSHNWVGMLLSKIRLRVSHEISTQLTDLLSADAVFAKEVFRINRHTLIQRLSHLSPSLPLSLSNLIYVWNHVGPHNAKAYDLTPQLILDMLRESD